MLLDFEEHHRHRRLMQDAFTRAAARGIHRGPGPGRGDRPRRLAAGSGLPCLPGPEVPHPRPRHPGLHGRRRPGPTGRDRPGQRRLRRLRPGGGRDHPQAVAGDALGACDEGSAAPGGVLRPAPREQAGQRRGGPVLGAVRAARRGRFGPQRPRRRQPHDLPADGGPRHLHDHRDHDDAAARRPPGVARPAARGGGPPAGLAAPSTSSTSWSPSTW